MRKYSLPNFGIEDLTGETPVIRAPPAIVSDITPLKDVINSFTSTRSVVGMVEAVEAGFISMTWV